MYCRKCGNEVKDTDRFCSVCGREISVTKPNVQEVQIDKTVENDSTADEVSGGTGENNNSNTTTTETIADDFNRLLDKDPYFVGAGMLIIDNNKASVGMLQREFKLEFNRAARLMDQLAEAGVVGEENGTKPREVLMSMQEFVDYCEHHKCEPINKNVSLSACETIPKENIVTDNKEETKKKKPILIAIGVIVAVVILIMLVKASNPVNLVKEGTFNGYPEQTVGDAFEQFFSNPEWVSYKESGETYVKFTGQCTLYGEMVTAKIVFLIEGKEFNIDRCKIGNVNITSVYDMESVLDVIYE